MLCRLWSIVQRDLGQGFATQRVISRWYQGLGSGKRGIGDIGDLLFDRDRCTTAQYMACWGEKYSSSSSDNATTTANVAEILAALK